MNLDTLKNKKILLFGKSRAFSKDEFEMQLKAHKIELLQAYDESVDFIIDGTMMTPLETIENEKLYEQKVAEFLNIEMVEKLLTQSIDPDVLMMSLKLSSDTQRLKNFLLNPKINDELYFKLLGMYQWGDDDFYENDDNRDVSASIIKRFYKNIERNHNVEFSKLGLMHLVLQCENEKVIETIAYLKPLKKSFNATQKDHGFRIVTSIATNNCTSNKVLKMLIKESNTYVRTLISMRDFLDKEVQEVLYETNESKVLESLSYSANISDELYEKLRENDTYARHMASYIKLDQNKYDFFKDKFPAELAQNESIHSAMQGELVNNHLSAIKEKLASNKSISHEMILRLLKQKDPEVDFAIYANSSTHQDILIQGYKSVKNHRALAENENTPANILHHLYSSHNPEILAALAKNVATPTEILYQLQLDSKYERFVKENPSFGKHIQKENIGWEV